MEKFSVKKPFTVLVAVIMVLMLGFVSITKMKTNLLPNVSTPYLMVVTVYPGASPERVETEVSDVLQNALTVPGVSKITATSAENYSLLLMQFVDDTDMDSALVQVSNKLDQAKSDLPETVLTPSVIQYSMNMNAFMTVAVSREGSSVYDLSDFIKNTMTPYVQRKGGVSSVSSSGLVEQLVQVQLNQEKVDAINEKLMELIDTQLEVAHTQLEEAEAKIKAGRAEYDKQFKNFGNTVSNTVMGSLSSEVGSAVEVVRKQAEALLQSVNNLIAVVKEPEVQQALIEVQAGLQRVLDKFNSTGMRDIDSLIEIVSELRDITDKLSSALQTLQNRINTETGTQGEGAADLADELQLQDSLNVIYKTLEDTIKAMDNVPGMMSEFSKALGNFTQQQMVAYMQFTEAREQLNEYEKQLSEAKTQYEAAKEKALASADVTKQLDIKTLATLIYAQNFSMPAGYVKDESGESWLLKVGEEYDSVDDIRGALLLHVEGYGDVRLSDVADVEIIDNAADSYTRLNGEQASVLKIYKDDSSSAGDVSANCLDAFKELEAQYEGLHVVVLSNQGNYISILIKSILTSMLVGAALAIVVLAIFLKDVKPTLVVGVSIPLSVLFAVVLMYFTGLDLNVMTLAGLSLGIGMLVDNSVVVIENIYRLRGRGVPAPQASVQGARQVSGSIISSTLTTICVFLPMIFSTGMVRELLTDMALTITFSLLASLIVALTVVPCAGSTVLRTQKEVKHPLFDKLLDGYEKALRFCLKVKALPLGLAIGLLVLSVWRIATMGIVMIPDMGSNQLSITVDVADDTAKDDAFATADAVMDAVSALDGVQTVGAMSGGNSMVSMMGSDAAVDNTTFTYYVLLTDEGARRGSEIQEQITDATASLPCEVTVNANGMMDMSALSGSGIEVDLYGSDLNDLNTAAGQVVDLLNSVDGIANASDGQENGDEEINISIDKDKAMRMGLTVAQVYQQVAAKLTTDTTATTLKANGTNYTVTIVDKTETPDLDSLFNMEFETTTTDEDGSSVTETHTLGEFATRTTSAGFVSIARENGSRKMSVTSETVDGYNTTLLSREVEPKLAALDLPDGVTAELAGETTQVAEMLQQMVLMMTLALIFVYFVMVAQFQSLLSPFIVLFTIPLAFTGGMLGLMIAGEQLSLISLMGFLVLMGVVVNNGIVFVDYANQLRIGGLERTDALVATGRTRMRPILMTTLTTVLAMVTMLFSQDVGSDMSKGMAIVIIGGLTYATLMTLFIVPVMYDLFYRKPPVNIDVGDDGMDELPDDATEFAAEFAARRAGAAQPAADAKAEPTFETTLLPPKEDAK